MNTHSQKQHNKKQKIPTRRKEIKNSHVRPKYFMKVFHEMPLKLYFILALRILKSKKKKLALTFFYCLGQDT